MIWNALLAGFTDSGMDPKRKKEGRKLRRIPWTEMLDEGILVEDMHLGMREHFTLKEYSTGNILCVWSTKHNL